MLRARCRGLGACRGFQIGGVREKMSRREYRILIVLGQLLIAGGCALIITFNRLTLLGWICAGVFFVIAVLAEVVAWRTGKDSLGWLGPLFAGLCMAVFLLFQFAPPREEPGLLVDTSHAWEKYVASRRESD